MNLGAKFSPQHSATDFSKSLFLSDARELLLDKAYAISLLSRQKLLCQEYPQEPSYLPTGHAQMCLNPSVRMLRIEIDVGEPAVFCELPITHQMAKCVVRRVFPNG